MDERSISCKLLRLIMFNIHRQKTLVCQLFPTGEKSVHWRSDQLYQCDPGSISFPALPAGVGQVFLLLSLIYVRLGVAPFY